MPDTDTESFYDDLAEDYHLIYGDWWSAVERQSGALDALISSRLGPGPRDVLDCTCGIGTQALGLARLGHDVLGTDLSARAIARARKEADARALTAVFRRWDVRDIESLPEGPFQIVLSADNALPHLTDDDELRDALRGMWLKTSAGGATIVAMRDYDQIRQSRPGATRPHVFGALGERRVVLQLWTWHEGEPRYRLDHLIMKETASGWHTDTRATEYRALGRRELERCFDDLGASDMEWIEPDASGFFEPILWVSRPRTPAR